MSKALRRAPGTPDAPPADVRAAGDFGVVINRARGVLDLNGGGFHHNPAVGSAAVPLRSRWHRTTAAG